MALYEKRGDTENMVVMVRIRLFGKPGEDPSEQAANAFMTKLAERYAHGEFDKAGAYVVRDVELSKMFGDMKKVPGRCKFFWRCRHGRGGL